MKKYSELLSEFLRERNIESDGEFVESQEFFFEHDISRERYDITTDKQSKYYKKEKGRYELISIPDPLGLDKTQINYITNILEDLLKSFLGKISSGSRILVVGLGNRHISSDSLGTKVLSKINITIENRKLPKVMAICPSVLGLTGIETYDIVSGVVENVKPTHLIIVDSLCAGCIDRLGRSIQITNTGVCPGSGIGNNRKCIGSNLAPNVVSIGVPLLIYASTFISDAFERVGIRERDINSIMHSIKNINNVGKIKELLVGIKKVYNSELNNTIVSIKDIEECVDILSDIISKSLNSAFGVILN